ERVRLLSDDALRPRSADVDLGILDPYGVVPDLILVCAYPACDSAGDMAVAVLRRGAKRSVRRVELHADEGPIEELTVTRVMSWQVVDDGPVDGIVHPGSEHRRDNRGEAFRLRPSRLEPRIRRDDDAGPWCSDRLRRDANGHEPDPERPFPAHCSHL